MPKKVIVNLLIIAGLGSLSIYDFTGNYRVSFDISELQGNTIMIDTNVFQEYDNRSIEIVWSTGDTGSTIIIDRPGTYIVSVKDVWRIMRADGSGYNITDTVEQKCVFIYGYPDDVRIDTIVMDTVFPESFNKALYHTYDIINSNGVVNQVTFIDTSWTDETRSYYTETHPIHTGFWSGMLDTIIVQKQKLPVVINAKVMMNEGNIIIGDKWRAIY